MPKKMIRAAHRSQRGCSEKHNDRNYDTEKTDNIDPEKTRNNINWVWADDELSDDEKDCEWSECQTFADWEKAYYDMMFSESLEIQNEKYTKQGQRGRIKTMGEIFKNKNKGPEDLWIQMGKAADKIEPEIFKKCALLYFEYLKDWNNEHGNPMGIMSMSIHLDEATPHMQIRRCWQYEDDNKIMHIGQDKALAKAGIELPDPTKPRSSKNNRKMTFDKMMREKWIEIVEANSDYEINKVPLPRRKHVSKAEYIQQQDQEIADSKAELTALKANLESEREEIRIIKENTLKNEIRAKNDYSDAELARFEATQYLQQTKRYAEQAVALLDDIQNSPLPPGLEEFCKTYTRKVAKTEVVMGKRQPVKDAEGKPVIEIHNCFDDWQAQITRAQQTNRVVKDLLDQADEMQQRQQNMSNYDFNR